MSNYCLVKVNKIYEEIYDMLEDKNLSMHQVDDTNNILYEIKKIVTNNQNIIISDNMDCENLLEEIMVNITKDDINNTKQGNTVLLYASDDYMYELVYMEDYSHEQGDEYLNQLASICNIELIPIYGDICIVKTSYKNKVLESKELNLNDIINIIISNFYHTGIMIYADNTHKEIMFSGDKPNYVIGNTFSKVNQFEIFGLVLVIYSEDVKSDKNNEIVSKLMDEEINGKVFITLLCPLTNKKYWNITNTTIKNILSIKENKDSLSSINKEIFDDKLINPFFLIKKYCVV